MKIQVTEYKRKQPFDLFVFSGIIVKTNYVFSKKKKKTSRLSKIIICLRRILNILMNNSDENIP